MASSEAVRFSGHGGRIGMAGAALFVAIAIWLGAYASGAAPWLGYASVKSSSIGAGPISIIGETGSHATFGLDTFYFFAGQEIVIEYEAEIAAGSLWFHVFRPFDGTLGDGMTHYVTKSGAGTWTARIPESGLYAINIEPSPARGAGRGWDLSYSVWWGARPA